MQVKSVYTLEEIYASKSNTTAFVTFDNIVSGRAVHGVHGWVNIHKALSPAQQKEMLKFFGKKCSEKTLEAMREAFDIPELLKPCSLFARIHIYSGHVEYVCGQSWPEEMRELRKLFKARKYVTYSKKATF